MATHFPTGATRSRGPHGRVRSALAPYATFLREFARHPSMVGSAIPSSRWMVDAMLAPVDWSAVRLLVEYGPGTGSFTTAALERMRPDAALVAIDTSDGFVRFLRDTVADPRLHAVTASATDVRAIVAAMGFDTADCVLSGLPFSTLPAGVGARIVAETRSVLAPSGSFLAYQVSPVVRTLMERVFATVTESFEWRNIPPCHLYRAEGHACGRAIADRSR